MPPSGKCLDTHSPTREENMKELEKLFGKPTDLKKVRDGCLDLAFEITGIDPTKAGQGPELATVHQLRNLLFGFYLRTVLERSSTGVREAPSTTHSNPTDPMTSVDVKRIMDIIADVGRKYSK